MRVPQDGAALAGLSGPRHTPPLKISGSHQRISVLSSGHLNFCKAADDDKRQRPRLR